MNNFLLIPSLKNDWITLIFLLIFILLVLVKLIYKDRLFLLATIGISKKYFLNYGKDSRLIFNGFNSMLFVVQSLIMMLIIYAFLQFFEPKFADESSFLLQKIISGVSIVFIIRYVIGKGLGELFDLKNSHNHVAFVKMSYLFSVFLLILPFLLLVFYSNKYNLLFFQLLIGVLAILLIIRYLFVFVNNKKIISSQMFYFILYICALEIAPIFIVFKIFDKIVNL
jgi:hypothetical protein